MSPGLSALQQPQPAPAVADRQYRVLIIDDDDYALGCSLLPAQEDRESTRWRPIRAPVGLAKAKAESPSAIVLDLCLPDADGLAICEQLTDAPETCSVPILILSGTDEPGIVRRCRAAGCHYFLRKPYDPNALLVLMRQAIRERAIGRLGRPLRRSAQE